MATSHPRWRIRSAAALLVLIVVAAAVTGIRAGSGNLGRTSTSGAGGSKTDASVNPSFSQSIAPGQLISNVTANLVAQIDADPTLAATVIVDPDDPNSNSFRVTKQGGAPVDHMQLCENDSNIDNIGISSQTGKDIAKINKVTALNADGNFILTVSSFASSPTSQTFNTTAPPNNTPTGLNSSISSFLTGAGYTVTDEGVNFAIRRSGTTMKALRASSTDTGVVVFCVEMLNIPSNVTGVPSMTHVGLALLVLVLAGSGIWLLRRS